MHWSIKSLAIASLAILIGRPAPAARAAPNEWGEPASAFNTFSELVDPSQLGGDVAATVPVGTLPGSFSVDDLGNATYSIPIRVPPGRRGIEPRLGFSYDSGAGNGVLGVGWSLAGLSAIAPCPATHGSHGFTGASYAEEPLCLDGKLLEAVSSDGPDELRTVPDTFARVVSSTFETDNGEHDCFEVETKEGLIVEYGCSETSRTTYLRYPSPEEHTWAYYVNRIKDRDGNHLRANYATTHNSDGGQTVVGPSELRYTGNSETGDGPTKFVSFEYEERPDIGVSWVHPDTGTLQRIDVRLRALRVESSEAPDTTHEYRLTYDNAGDSGRSLLSSVGLCAISDTAEICLPATAFEYQLGQDGLRGPQHTGFEGPTSMPCNGPFAMDVNGDGCDEVVWAEDCGGDGTWWLMTAAANGAFLAPYNTHVRADSDAAYPIDADNDGKMDLLQLVDGGLDVSFGTGDSGELARFGAAGGLPRVGEEVEFAVAADMNGDGLGDVVACEEFDEEFSDGNQRIVWYRNRGAGLDAFEPGDAKHFQSDVWVLCESTVLYSDQTSSGTSFIRLGSARPDVDYSRDWFPGVLTLGGLAGDLTFYDDPALDPTVWLAPRLQFDAHGDGLGDALLLSSPGNPSWVPGRGESWVLHDSGIEHPRELERALPFDWNGDGYDDVLFPARVSGSNWDDWNVAVFDPSAENTDEAFKHAGGTGIAAHGSDSDNPPALVGEFDGDGLADFLHVDEEIGEWVLYRHEPATFTRELPNQETLAVHDLLRSITDGYGHRTDIRYRPMADENVYRVEEGCEYPARCIIDSRPLVSRVAVEDGAGGQHVTEHDYRDARFDLWRRTFLGFAERIITRVPQDGLDYLLTRIIRYDNATETYGNLPTSPSEWSGEPFSFKGYPFAGLVSEDLWFLSSPEGNFASRTSYEWAYRRGTAELEDGDGATTYFPYLRSRQAEQFELDDADVSGPFDEEDIDGATPLRTHQVRRELDDFGNVLVAEHTIGDSVTTVTSEYMLQDPGPNIDSSMVDWLWAHRHLRRRHVVSSLNGVSKERESEWSYEVVDSSRGGNVRVQREDLESGDLDLWRATNFAYDDYGNVVGTIILTAADGVRMSFIGYDEAEHTYPDLTINPMLHVARYAWDPFLGAVSIERDPFGVETHYEYDGFGRQLKETVFGRAGTPRGDTRTFEYWRLDGGAPNSPSRLRSRVAIAGSGDVIRRHDRLARVVREEWTGVGRRVYREFRYDGEGLLEEFSVPADVGQTPISTTRFKYDPLGRLIARANADGHVWEYRHTGLETVRIDPEGNESHIHKNDLGQVALVEDALGTGFCYEYGPFGYLERVQKDCLSDPIDALEIETDAYGRMTAVSEPGGQGDRQYDYSAYGDLLEIVDGEGRPTRFTYDRLSRLIRRRDDDGTTRWRYDVMPGLWLLGGPNPGPSAAYVPGLLTASRGVDGHRKTLRYDEFGRLIRSRSVVEGERFDVRSSYDNLNRLATVGYPTTSGDQFSVRYYYDSSGHLRRVRDTNSGVVYWELRQADADGRVTRESFGNGVATQRYFDERNGRLDRVVTGRPMTDTTWAERFQDLLLEYSPNGNMERRFDLVWAQEEVAGYDELNRLVSVDIIDADGVHIRSASYDYDQFGNLEFRSDVGEITSTSAEGRVDLVDGTEAYVYDGNGNLRRAGDRLEIDYTPVGKPRGLATSDTSLLFEYDADGNRVLRLSDGGEQTVYVDGLYERVTSSEGVAEKRYVFAGGRPVAVAEHVDAGGGLFQNKTYYVHNDHIGSTEVVTDATGSLAQRMSFGPWGKRRNQQWYLDGAFENQTGVNIGFAGHMETDDAALINMGGRLYEPRIGRFISPDPIVQVANDTQSFNRYSYVRDNPLTFYDPDGYEIALCKGSSGAFCTGLANLWSFFAGLGEFLSGSQLDQAAGIYGAPPPTWADAEAGPGWALGADRLAAEAGGVNAGDLVAGRRSGRSRAVRGYSWVVAGGGGGGGSRVRLPFSARAYLNNNGMEAYAGDSAVAMAALRNELGDPLEYFRPASINPSAKGFINAQGDFVWAQRSPLHTDLFDVYDANGEVEGRRASPAPTTRPLEVSVEVGSSLLPGAFAARAASMLGRFGGGLLAKYAPRIAGRAVGGLLKSQTATALRSASEAYKGSTRLGHALSKHAGRNPGIWGRLRGSIDTWHEQGMRHFREIYRGPGSFQRVTTDKGLQFIEKRLPDGRGIRLNLDYTFKGFVD